MQRPGNVILATLTNKQLDMGNTPVPKMGLLQCWMVTWFGWLDYNWFGSDYPEPNWNQLLIFGTGTQTWFQNPNQETILEPDSQLFEKYFSWEKNGLLPELIGN